MKHWLVAIAVFISCMSISYETQATDLKRNGSFDLYLYQDGTYFNVVDSVVKIKKTSFSFVVEFEGQLYLHVNASPDDESLRQALEGRPFKNIVGFTHTGMAERRFNPDEHVVPRKDSSHYWLFESMDEHRFSEVRRGKGGYVCSRVISQYYHRVDREFLPLAQYPHNEMNFVLISVLPTKWRDPVVEFERKTLKIIFED